MSTHVETAIRGKVTLGGQLKSEAIRFFSLNSTRILILVAIVLNVGIGTMVVWGFGSFSADSADMAGAPIMESADMTAELVGSGVVFSQLILGVLGVLLVSGEFTTGSAVSTFLASPQRMRVVAAKTILIIVLTAVVQIVSMLLAYLACKPLANKYNMSLELFGQAFQGVLWYGALAVVMAAVIGLALGLLLRNSAGGITSLVALFFVLPMVAGIVSMWLDWFQKIAQFLPDQLGMALAMPISSPSDLEIWQQLLGVGCWLVIPLVAGALVLKTKDI